MQQHTSGVPHLLQARRETLLQTGGARRPPHCRCNVMPLDRRLGAQHRVAGGRVSRDELRRQRVAGGVEGRHCRLAELAGGHAEDRQRQVRATLQGLGIKV